MEFVTKREIPNSYESVTFVRFCIYFTCVYVYEWTFLDIYGTI